MTHLADATASENIQTILEGNQSFTALRGSLSHLHHTLLRLAVAVPEGVAQADRDEQRTQAIREHLSHVGNMLFLYMALHANGQHREAQMLEYALRDRQYKFPVCGYCDS